MEGIVGSLSEISCVIAGVSTEYYRQATSEAVAGRLARAHQKAWDAVMSGGPAAQAYADLRRQAERLIDGANLLEGCDRHIVWALTPVIAASLACDAGHARVDLREVGAALWRMLQVALRGAEGLSQDAPEAERRAA
ncbi:MAG: hypothetical protein KGM42_14285 [Hyphomicrobiales bacterium]|nr:hypothetical protein [Hyphomicrobiales bacterium]